MAFTFDPTTDLGRVRLLSGDSEAAFKIFDDDAIQAFLDLENGIVKLAAALVIDTIANSEAYIRKVLKIGDQQIDGAKVADALHKGAQALRDSLANETAWDVAEQINGPFVALEILEKDWQRHAL